MTQHIHEGTPRELATYLALHPERKFQLIELADANGELMTGQEAPVAQAEVEAGLALLDAWIAEGRAADENTRQDAENEVEEFKRSMNANRAAMGEHPIYP